MMDTVQECFPIFPIHVRMTPFGLLSRNYWYSFPHTYGDETPKHSLVTQITQNRVAHHKKHVVHFMYKTRGLEKVTDVKLIENQIV